MSKQIWSKRKISKIKMTKLKKVERSKTSKKMIKNSVCRRNDEKRSISSSIFYCHLCEHSFSFVLLVLVLVTQIFMNLLVLKLACTKMSEYISIVMFWNFLELIVK